MTRREASSQAPRSRPEEIGKPYKRDALGKNGEEPHLEAVHLGEDLVERLLALVVAAGDARAALPADGVDLVDEDDARRRLLRLPPPQESV
jgi:hypothetical protein